MTQETFFEKKIQERGQKKAGDDLALLLSMAFNWLQLFFFLMIGYVVLDMIFKEFSFIFLILWTIIQIKEYNKRAKYIKQEFLE